MAVALLVLLLALPALALGIWALRRAGDNPASRRRARVVVAIALAELLAGALAWTVYFVWLAPILALPAL